MLSANEFKGEIEVWARELRVKPVEIHIRPMERKWGSCSGKGRLSFSIDLMEKSEEFRAKVIVHELLHLRYPTHTNMFRMLLMTHLKNKGFGEETVSETNLRNH